MRRQETWRLTVKGRYLASLHLFSLCASLRVGAPDPGALIRGSGSRLVPGRFPALLVFCSLLFVLLILSFFLFVCGPDVLLSRVTLDPSRVPSAGARWHLRPARVAGGARGALEAPSPSSSSSSAAGPSGGLRDERAHVSAQERESSSRVASRDESLSPVKRTFGTSRSVSTRVGRCALRAPAPPDSSAPIRSSCVHALLLCHITEIQEGEGGVHDACMMRARGQPTCTLRH